jgi:hypothetical protein
LQGRLFHREAPQKHITRLPINIKHGFSGE